MVVIRILLSLCALVWACQAYSLENGSRMPVLSSQWLLEMDAYQQDSLASVVSLYQAERRQGALQQEIGVNLAKQQQLVWAVWSLERVYTTEYIQQLVLSLPHPKLEQLSLWFLSARFEPIARHNLGNSYGSEGREMVAAAFAASLPLETKYIVLRVDSHQILSLYPCIEKKEVFFLKAQQSLLFVGLIVGALVGLSLFFGLMWLNGANRALLAFAGACLFSVFQALYLSGFGHLLLWPSGTYTETLFGVLLPAAVLLCFAAFFLFYSEDNLGLFPVGKAAQWGFLSIVGFAVMLGLIWPTHCGYFIANVLRMVLPLFVFGLAWRCRYRRWVLVCVCAAVLMSFVPWGMLVLKQPIEYAVAANAYIAGSAFLLAYFAYFIGRRQNTVFKRLDQLAMDSLEVTQHNNQSLLERIEARTQSLKSANARLAVYRYSDMLTKLRNADYMQYVYDQLLSANRLDNTRYCLLILDIDGLNQVNHKYGSQEGDHLLKHVAVLFKQHFRAEARVLVRCHGDRFVALFLNKSSADIATFSAQFLSQFATLKRRNGELFSISCSIGVAEFDQQFDLEHVFSRADRALATAKHQQPQHFQLISECAP